MKSTWSASRNRHQAWTVAGASVLLLTVLGWLLFASAESNRPRPDSPRADGSAGSDDDHLVVYCAAGIKPPVEAAALEYAREKFGREIQLQYGGSGTLLSNLRVARRGDLFLAADHSYIELARSQNLLDEAIPLATMRPVIAVRRGNPKDIESLNDLLRRDIRVALANPDAASIGKLTQQLLTEAGIWEQAVDVVKVFKPTVTEVANDVLLGAVDAGVVWDATVAQHADEIEIVRVPLFEEAANHITIGVLRWCRRPAAALHFARYLQAPEKGAPHFARFGYEPLDGDTWADTPTVTLFSGGVNRLAIQDTLREFEAREGVDVNVVYNGCGILVSMINGGQNPDAYFACDVSYMQQVRDKFGPSIDIAETDMIIIVQKGNPEKIESVRDLVRPGLKVGIANEEQSALGALTRRLFETIDDGQGSNLYEALQPNVAVRTPTADLLVNQLRTGALDAAIVYQANVPLVRDKLDVIPIRDGDPVATQPIAVSATSSNRYLTERLVETIRSNHSRVIFEEVGFRWRGESE